MLEAAAADSCFVFEKDISLAGSLISRGLAYYPHRNRLFLKATKAGREALGNHSGKEAE
jgi:hypothetical protein